MTRTLLFSILLLLMASCFQDHSMGSEEQCDRPAIDFEGSMKYAMWEGKHEGVIEISEFEGDEEMIAVGPLSGMSGEIMVSKGRSYVSKVISKTQMKVEETHEVSAPFLVFGQVEEWERIPLPAEVVSMSHLEAFIQDTTNSKGPYAIRLEGRVSSARIHVNALPDGTPVSHPDDVHLHQVKYTLGPSDVEVVGFYSTQHKGIFTQHDSFLHLHLLTADKRMMGHLDEMVIDQMTLFLPVK